MLLGDRVPEGQMFILLKMFWGLWMIFRLTA